ncbi:tRNA pseudouridine synthase A [Glaciihabitans sp. dw_435]|uniref:tRNA pseudouridine synthase A n=1 Tax=Glaciihabitans sp. dw_435 TaxID=2720081 RepID=UPI0027DBF6A2|nr:tRNA pseudouridine synthase A [Glaciihabitans sp. dw_435]
MENAAAPEKDDALTRLRLDIAYDGGSFNGWSKQPDLRTVQGAIEDALAIVFRRHQPIPTLTVAGRTDAGVHALGQVAHLDLTDAQLHSLDRPRRGKLAGRVYDGPASLGRRINGIAGLDSDVYVSRSYIAPDGFDARFSATWRRYEYRIADTAAPRNPLERHRTLWYPALLDVDVMNETAASLIGLYDWVAYCKPREGATTVRSLQEFTWHREDDGVLVARVKADAFCHSMVRSLVGACVAAGQGNLAPGRPAEIRDEAARTAEYKVMPAKGLVLVEVGYPDDAELGAQAELTRRRRTALVASGPGMDAPAL